MKETILENIKNSSDDLVMASARYVESIKDYYKAESEFNVVRAKILNMDRVANLSNQSLRDAEVEIILQGDERFRPLFERYQLARFNSRKCGIEFDVAKELNANNRALINNLTFGKE